jgi:hypothetical protein
MSSQKRLSNRAASIEKTTDVRLTDEWKCRRFIRRWGYEEKSM